MSVELAVSNKRRTLVARAGKRCWGPKNGRQKNYIGNQASRGAGRAPPPGPAYRHGVYITYYRRPPATPAPAAVARGESCGRRAVAGGSQQMLLLRRPGAASARQQMLRCAGLAVAQLAPTASPAPLPPACARSMARYAARRFSSCRAAWCRRSSRSSLRGRRRAGGQAGVSSWQKSPVEPR